MIKTFYQQDIIKRLGAIFTYGFEKMYSYKAIEEYITSSSFINELEDNKYNNESSIEEVVESVFKAKVDKADISFRGLFLAESYIRLFFYFKKSFEYLFLYWPLMEFNEKYNIYHEMDFSNLKIDFQKEIEKTTLLKKLCKEKHYKYTEISKLTGISENTLKKYSKDDKYIYTASYETIYKLSTLLGVKENIFISKLAIYLDNTIYLSDSSNDDYKNYLGFYYANYFDNRINEVDYKYNEKDKCFESNINKNKIVVLYINKNNPSFGSNEEIDLNTYVVIFYYGFYYNDLSNFDFLKTINAKEVMVITEQEIFIIRKGIKKEITDTINKSLIIRAKKKTD